MIAAFSPFLALRYLVTRRINVLSVFGVAFAVWAMLIVDGVFSGFVTEIRRDVHDSAPELLLTDLPHDVAYEPLRAALEADPDVAATAPRLRHHGLMQPLRVPAAADRPRHSSTLDFDHTENGFALVLGIDPLREPAVTDLGGWLRRGPEQLANYGVIRPASTVLDDPDPARRSSLLLPDEVEWRARRHAGLPAEADPARHHSIWPGALIGWRRVGSMPSARPGEPLDLLCAAFPADRQGNVQLRTHSLRFAFAGFFATGSRTFDETTVLVPIEALRTLLGHDAADPDSIELVTDVAIRPRAGLTHGELAALQRRLAAAVQPLLPAGSGPCAVLDWQQQNSVFLRAVAQEQAMMEFVLFVVMLVAGFVIYATLHMMVVQKVKDIGILAAVGGAPRDIGRVFLLSGTVVAAVGTLLGVFAGLASAALLNPFNDWLYRTFGVELFPRNLFDLPQIPCALEPSWIVTVAVGASALALLVAFLPARKAARMNPVKALSYE